MAFGILVYIITEVMIYHFSHFCATICESVLCGSYESLVHRDNGRALVTLGRNNDTGLVYLNVLSAE
ncbi:hypothetical protein VN97_g5122 [Penicillium thymicola]|uniref:Uncharacterized protein n=1 Tax=Penicillium thymicola TaxID=293382 RepID=A0AAI9TJ87_PENTH|nr:hypothetical protein VN97_g5122 [Penicillium thymicola]